MYEPKHTPGPWQPGRPDMFSLEESGPHERAGKSVYADDDRGGFHHVTGAKLPLEVCRAIGVDGDEAVHEPRGMEVRGPGNTRYLLSLVVSDRVRRWSPPVTRSSARGRCRTVMAASGAGG